MLTQLNATTLWQYDARWRKVQTLQPYGEAGFTVVEGKHHLAVIAQSEAGGEIEVTVRSARSPEDVLATGRFIDTWVFEGDSQAWAMVPEYIITTKQDGTKGLLRIADDAEIDPLEEFEPALEVVAVPNSRLVIIASSGAYTVYDPIAARAIRHFQLAGGNPEPTLRFRNNDELWVNDIDTMLKIETREFEEVLDAAGSDIEQEDTHGGFGRWTFAAGNELCVVTRPSVGDVLVLDVISMLPIARGVFSNGVPVEAVLVGRNTVVAVDVDGRALRTRVKKVAINFEPAPEADSAPEVTSENEGEERSSQ